MARPWRIEYKGAFYHVMSRGNEGRPVFSDNKDRTLFLNLLGDMSERFGVGVHAWVLMGNHYHLLIQTRHPNLSKAMQWLGATYTRRYNIRHKRQGHLFQGRFKSMLVEDDYYMFRVSCYIHRNPLRAKMVKRLADYKWSSYRAYAYGDTGFSWIEKGLILSFTDRENPHQSYRKIVQEYVGEEHRLFEDMHWGMVIGTLEFAKQIKSKFRPEQPDDEIPQQKARKSEYDVDATLKQAAGILGCDIEIFRKSGRISQKDKTGRDLLLCLLWKTGALTNKEIGRYFGMTYSGVSRRIGIRRNQLKKKGEFKREFDRISALIKM